jgi:hypothetical protein
MSGHDHKGARGKLQGKVTSGLCTYSLRHIRRAIAKQHRVAALAEAKKAKAQGGGSPSDRLNQQ